MSHIQQCAHCGERYGNSKAKYCQYCRTAEQKNKIAKENNVIKNENQKR